MKLDVSYVCFARHQSTGVW